MEHSLKYLKQYQESSYSKNLFHAIFIVGLDSLKQAINHSQAYGAPEQTDG